MYNGIAVLQCAGVLQGHRCSTGVYRYMSTTGIHPLYTDTGVVKGTNGKRL
jgi:hypothetical protein